MDMNAMTDRRILVNFRAPKELIELLDGMSRLYHRTRTSAILDSDHLNIKCGSSEYILFFLSVFALIKII
jgi:hypothetical protein